MNLLTKTLKTLTLSLLITSSTVLSADFLVNTTIADPDNGSGGKIYDIDRMEVSSSGNQITVDVFTNFVDYNNTYGTYNHHHSTGNIVLGDLLISTNGAGTPFNYAFLLSDADRERSNYYSESHWDSSGTLTEIGSTLTSKQYHHKAINVSSGTVMAGEIIDNEDQRQGEVDFDRVNMADGFDVISFSFNVDNISAFQTASQIAFSWGMSCANDIVQGIVDVNHPDGSTTKVPEPASLLLLIIALGLMANSRNKKLS